MGIIMPAVKNLMEEYGKAGVSPPDISQYLDDPYALEEFIAGEVSRIESPDFKLERTPPSQELEPQINEGKKSVDEFLMLLKSGDPKAKEIQSEFEKRLKSRPVVWEYYKTKSSLGG
jgi:hypothetical protein